MSASLATTGRMTVDDFIGWAEAQPEGRFELVDGVPIRMSPERNVHAVVKGAAYRALLDAVKRASLPFVVLPDGPTVVINEHRSRQPDVVVQPLAGLDWTSVVASAPIIVVEVLSPTTMGTDRGEKLGEYLSVESVEHYLVVDGSSRSVVHHRRIETSVTASPLVRTGEIRLDPPGLTIRVEDLFEDLPPAGLS